MTSSTGSSRRPTVEQDPAQQEMYRQLTAQPRLRPDSNFHYSSVETRVTTTTRPAYEIAPKDEDDGVIDSSNRFKELDI